ncbi:hypothetical protein ACVBEQ_27170 [Nakamurella sp. GG22]
MSTTTFTAPPAPRRNTARGGTAAMIVGVVLLVSGFLTAVSGAALLALFGAGQAVSSGLHPITSPTSAVVADLGLIDDVDDFRGIAGSPTLQLWAENVGQQGVFVGVGPTAEVNRYLAGVATERVDDLNLSPYRLNTTRTDGSAEAQAPGDQSFWVASSESSNRAELSWAIADGRYEVVVMNADGSAGILTSAEIGASLPDSTGIWLTIVVIGGAAMIVGGALVFVGTRRNRIG